jgi:hypothetical protein
MSWVRFEAATGGVVVVQIRHVVAIYDEQGQVKLETASGGVHILKDMTVQRAASMVTRAEETSGIAGNLFPARPSLQEG